MASLTTSKVKVSSLTTINIERFFFPQQQFSYLPTVKFVSIGGKKLPKAGTDIVTVVRTKFATKLKFCFDKKSATNLFSC